MYIADNCNTGRVTRTRLPSISVVYVLVQLLAFDRAPMRIGYKNEYVVCMLITDHPPPASQRTVHEKSCITCFKPN